MAIGTVTIAVCPTYASIGVAAPHHRSDRPLAAGLLRRRRARRRLGLSRRDLDARQQGFLYLVPILQSAGRDLRRRDHRIFPQRSRDGRYDCIPWRARIRQMANSVLRRLPHHSLHLRAAPNAGGNAGIPGDEETSLHLRGLPLRRGELEDHRAGHDGGDSDHHDLLFRHRLHADLRQERAEAFLSGRPCSSPFSSR